MSLVLPSIGILCAFIIHLSFLADGSRHTINYGLLQGVGINYGLLGYKLPPPTQVILLLRSRNIPRIRLFSPNLDILSALQLSGIRVIVGTVDADIPNLAGDINFAMTWVLTNILPFAKTITFRCIYIGNEVLPSQFTPFVFPAMQNMNAALKFFNLRRIPVSTAVGILTLANSSHPSGGDFEENVKPVMQNITRFLANNGFPLLVTVYPYFAYVNEPGSIPLSYVLFNSSEVVVRDGALGYTNMFDAMVDAFYSALEKNGGGSVEVVVCDSGWPSQGNGEFTTTELAQTYNQNLVRHVLASGTPKKPDDNVETYVFALFNENQKDPGVEQHFGLFNPDMTEVYHVDFNN